MEYILAHEAAHVKHQHGRKQFLFAIVLFAVLIVVSFRLPSTIGAFRPVLDLAVITAPVVALYSLSRRFEYAADREAVSFTGNPETAIRALAALHAVSGVPIGCDKFSELFLTHPALTHRAAAIARGGQLAVERVAVILRDSNISPEDAASHE